MNCLPSEELEQNFLVGQPTPWRDTKENTQYRLCTHFKHVQKFIALKVIRFSKVAVVQLFLRNYTVSGKCTFQIWKEHGVSKVHCNSSTKASLPKIVHSNHANLGLRSRLLKHLCFSIGGGISTTSRSSGVVFELSSQLKIKKVGISCSQ